MIFKISKKDKKYNSGVTLLELIVVISIFMILTAIGIFDYNKFKSSISTQNLADDIALSIRKAQNLAVGVSNVSNSYQNKYGVYFSKGDPTQFIIFTEDIPDNGQYDDGEAIETLIIKNGDKISAIKDDKGNDLNDVDIIFQRPNPEPVFNNSISFCSIVVSNAKNDVSKTIMVYSNGQIAVSQ